jgi:Membrane proteins related to metalloendopeptidases
MTKRRRRPKPGRRTQKNQSRRQLYQLAVCLFLFAATFLGRSALPDHLTQTFRRNTDFVGAFSTLGKSLSLGEPVGESLGDFAVAVFGAATPTPPPYIPLPAPEAPTQRLAPTVRSLPVEIPQPIEVATAEPTLVPPAPTPAPPEPAPQFLSPIPAPTDGLPPKATLDAPPLDLHTVLPVSGAVSSHFGYRSDPFDGGMRFHYGVDIAADEGTDIRAWADGTVEYIGEADDFGLYLKIAHPNGVSSFYAHCSALLVKPNQTITAGQVVARVGSTGRSTGPHLHMEIRFDGLYVDPLHYLELAP